MTPNVFLYPAAIRETEYPDGCPFRIARAEQTYQKAKGLGVLSGSDRKVIIPTPATRAQLERFHTPEYLDELERASRGDLSESGLHRGLGTADTPIFPQMLEIGQAGAGAVLHGAQRLLDGEAQRVFSPLGGFHHAMRDHASGFCYINDIVLGALHLADAGKRVLILDIDAHHGDGMQAAFYDRADIMTISLHESGKYIFPETGFENEIGEGPGKGYNINLCFPPDTYDDIYLQAFHAVVPPLIASFRPDVIILELGMDTLASDPLTHLSLTNNAPAEIVRYIRDLNTPLLATGGGGYHVENTVRAWTRMWEVLCDDEQDPAMAFGMGGTLLETADWRGGLPDREAFTPAKIREQVDPEVRRTIALVREYVFPLHNL
jgi:acetoin utilization protein AcuC